MCHLLPANAGDEVSISGLGRLPGEGNDNSLQYSCLENPMDRGAWLDTVSPWGHKESDTTERLNNKNNFLLCINMMLMT